MVCLDSISRHGLDSKFKQKARAMRDSCFSPSWITDLRFLLSNDGKTVVSYVLYGFLVVYSKRTSLIPVTLL